MGASFAVSGSWPAAAGRPATPGSAVACGLAVARAPAAAPGPAATALPAASPTAALSTAGPGPGLPGRHVPVPRPCRRGLLPQPQLGEPAGDRLHARGRRRAPARLRVTQVRLALHDRRDHRARGCPATDPVHRAELGPVVEPGHGVPGQPPGPVRFSDPRATEQEPA